MCQLHVFQRGGFLIHESAEWVFPVLSVDNVEQYFYSLNAMCAVMLEF